MRSGDSRNFNTKKLVSIGCQTSDDNKSLSEDIKERFKLLLKDTNGSVNDKDNSDGDDGVGCDDDISCDTNEEIIDESVGQNMATNSQQICDTNERVVGDNQSDQILATDLAIDKLQCPVDGCPFRSQSTDWRKSLRRHIRARHPEPGNKPDKPVVLGKPLLKCPHSWCIYETQSKQCLHKHMVVRHGKSKIVRNISKPLTLKYVQDNNGWYLCQYDGCAKSCKSKDILRRHIRYYHLINPCVCDADGCYKRFKTTEALRVHKHTNHKESVGQNKAKNGQQICVTSNTNERVVGDNQSDHNLVTNLANDKYECPVKGCPFTSKWQKRVKYHIRAKHPESGHKPNKTPELLDKPWLNCPHSRCIYRTQYKQNLDKHIVLQHCKPQIKRKRWSIEYVQNDQGYYVCQYADCGKSFKDKLCLSQHIRYVHIIEPCVCDADGCGKRYNTISALNEHRNRCHNPNPKHCPHPGCEFTSGSRSQVNKHQLTHLTDKCHKCPLDGCDQQFRTERMLTDHQLRMHYNHFPDRPWIECPKPGCEWRTKMSHDLRVHSRSHTKPYRCSQCDKCFSTAQDLKTHKIRLHDPSKRIPCEWPGCDKTFVKRVEMKQHMNGHTGDKVYKCWWPGCDQTYLNAYSLAGHQANHQDPTGASKPVQRCEWPGCGYKTRSAVTFKNHMNKHNGLDDYQCTRIKVKS